MQAYYQKSHLSIWTLLIIATIASFIGLLILYYICRLISEEKLYRFVDRHGVDEVKRFERQMIGLKSMVHGCIFMSFVPVLRVLITILALIE